MRNLKFETGQYYHICNRGTDKRNIFLSAYDFARFIEMMRLLNRKKPIQSIYRYKQLKEKEQRASKSLQNPRFCSDLDAPIVKFLCYTLIPNHYHFILKQITDQGIPKFMHKIGVGYTSYFNTKNQRTGSLFQGTYQAYQIPSTYKLLRVSCYINGNAEIHKIAKADKWPWSSYQDYLNLRRGTLCNKNIILEGFKNPRDYQDLTNDIIKESQAQKQEIAEFSLE
jgi:putative transposase